MKPPKVPPRARALFSQTLAERAAYRNGLTLFFGALLGANLALLDGLDIRSYITLVALLAGVVMAFQLIGRSRSRLYSFVNLGIYAGLLAYAVAYKDSLALGLAAGRLDQLLATLAIWLLGLAMIELIPIIDEADLHPEKEDPE